MSSIRSQLELLSPILQVNKDLEVLESKLLKLNAPSYFESKVSLLDALARMKEPAIYCFPSANEEKDFISKANELLAAQGINISIQGEDRQAGWTITINGEKIELGVHERYTWLRHAYEILAIPDFYRKTCKALKPYLTNGRYYYGYYKEEKRGPEFFAFAILFLQPDQVHILDHYRDMEWKILGDEQQSEKMDSVDFTNKDGTFILSYRSGGTILASIAVLLGIGVLAGIVNQFFRILEVNIPGYGLALMGIAALLLGGLDFLNRTAKIVVNAEHFQLTQGIIPLLPGYKRVNLPIRDILRVWTETKTETAGTTDTGPHFFETTSLYAQTKQNKVKLINHLEKSACEFISGKIGEFVK